MRKVVIYFSFQTLIGTTCIPMSVGKIFLVIYWRNSRGFWFTNYCRFNSDFYCIFIISYHWHYLWRFYNWKYLKWNLWDIICWYSFRRICLCITNLCTKKYKSCTCSYYFFFRRCFCYYCSMVYTQSNFKH